MPIPPIPVRFYLSPSGKIPVREWLRSLTDEDQQTIGQDLLRVQYRWPTGMPLVRGFGDGLWELRSSLPGQRISRMLLCFFEEELFVLHGFLKKTQKTPREDLELARRRMKEVKE